VGCGGCEGCEGWVLLAVVVVVGRVGVRLGLALDPASAGAAAVARVVADGAATSVAPGDPLPRTGVRPGVDAVVAGSTRARSGDRDALRCV